MSFFVLQKLPAVLHDTISEELKYLQHFGKLYNKPPDNMTINTISFHLIGIEVSQNAGKEFLKLMRKIGICNLSCSIKSLPPHENEKSQLTISAMATSVKGNGILIKFRVSLINNDEEKFKFNINNYGNKLIELGSPDGFIFQSFNIMIHPEDDLKPPIKFIFLDKRSKRQIVNDVLSSQLESEDGLHQFTVPSFNNTVELPNVLDDMDYNVWSLIVDINGYEPIVIKFINMLGWKSIDSPRKVLVETLILPLCKRPINKKDFVEIWQGKSILIIFI
jgi:hypothetical protein